MAFLFKSKKHDKIAAANEKAQAQAQANSSQTSQATDKKRSEDFNEKSSTTTGSSVNNSINSLVHGEHVGNSPEYQNGRRPMTSGKGSSDLPLRNMTAPPAHAPSAGDPASALYPWQQKRLTYTSAHPSPFPRYGAAVNSLASKEGDIYLMGGLINSSMVKGDLWMVEAGSMNLACYPLATAAEGPGPRVGHASLLVGNAFIVYGGDTKMEDTDILDETLYLLNTSTRQWSRALPPGPRPCGRYGHTLNILGSKIYVFGGQVEGYFMNDLVAFDLNQLQSPKNTWETLMSNSDEKAVMLGITPPARTNHSVVTFNDKLYLFGGTNGFQWFNDVWSYDRTMNEWSQEDCIGYIPAPREGHAAALVDDVMYIFGGRTVEGADLGDLAAFRISSRRWYTFQNMGPSPLPRSGHSMTSWGKQIVVLGGEPSTAAVKEIQDLSIIYILDTAKIRYPNDQQIQQSNDRIPGQRRPSGGEKTGMMGIGRNLSSREGPPSSLPEPKRYNSIQSRQGGMGGPISRPVNGVNNTIPADAVEEKEVSPVTQQPQSDKAASKLPRASVLQAPVGPPPAGLAPVPRPDGIPVSNGVPRSQPGNSDRGYDPALDTTNVQAEPEPESAPEEQPRPPSPVQQAILPTKENAMTSGRRTPTAQQVRSIARQESVERTPPTAVPPQVRSIARQESVERPSPSVVTLPQPVSRSNSKARLMRQQNSVDSTNTFDSSPRTATTRPSSPPPPSRQGSNSIARRTSNNRSSQSVALLKELEGARSRNAWLVSELELARKSGYNSTTHGSMPESASTENFAEADRPLIEALIAMRAELNNIQGSVDQQAIVTARRIAEVEKQRDAAVSEAIYAKAKLAAHGGSQGGTPQLDRDTPELDNMSANRSSDIGRKLASALATQTQLEERISTMTAELEAERQNRELAEDTADVAQSRATDLETYRQSNSSQVETLKAQLHQLEISSREQAISRSEAVASAQMLQHDKNDLDQKHKELLENTKDHDETFESLRAAIASREQTRTLLESKLEQERSEREQAQDQLLKLKTEHQNQTAELESANRKLRDTQELADRHAHEAQIHRQAVMSGLDRVANREVSAVGSDGGRVATLQSQLDGANTMVREYQAAADAASEKLRGAEERIAGLEAYQEQASREGLGIRKQLQTVMRETQTLQAANSELKSQLSNQQLETNAINVQHNTLKDLLSERGISPIGAAARSRGLNSPQNRTDTPDQPRLRELESQVVALQQAHDETKQANHAREQEQEAGWREKLAQLDNDYQSAVHYVKGTEKMLKRMKEELSRAKAENNRLRGEVEEAHAASAASTKHTSDWEEERSVMHSRVEGLEKELQDSHNQLEKQMQEVRNELEKSQRDRDFYRTSHEDSQHQLSNAMQQARADLNQLQTENAQLEQRCLDAEQKVSLLLDQVESSVDNYRRQSRLAVDMSSAPQGHMRNLSGHESIGGDSVYSVNGNAADRSSLALDSLASELETLRTHWETTNKNYRLSNTYDYDLGRPTPSLAQAAAVPSMIKVVDPQAVSTSSPSHQQHYDMNGMSSGGSVGGNGELSLGLAEWRKRLAEDEMQAQSRHEGEDYGFIVDGGAGGAGGAGGVRGAGGMHTHAVPRDAEASGMF